MSVKYTETSIPGVLLIEPDVFKDDRGFFLETYHQEKYAKGGINKPFVQDNRSHSKKGVLRGLHYQLGHAQAKLARVTRGRVFDVVVDIRRGSPSFANWAGIELSEDNRLFLFAPEGFAHGFLVLSEVADFQYKCSDFFSSDDERGLPWNDPAIGIEWPLDGLQPALSDRDRGWVSLEAVPADQLPEYRP